jgi:hypothetical protein
MKFIKFHEPNFICKLEDRTGYQSDNLFYAQSEDELREFLEEKRYKIISLEPYDFEIWKSKAAKATQDVVDAFNRGEKLKFDAKLWSEVKLFLFFLSQEKCGYCESPGVLVTDAGQVEHYRPKSSVDEDKTHPGYYWLAYDIENYVPCCGQCNTYRGKRTQFPVDGTNNYAREPGSVELEPRLLLHPFFDKPEVHLQFIEKGHEQGMLKGLDKIGETSISVYNLNRKHLVDARLDYLEHLDLRLNSARKSLFIRKKIMDDYRLGKTPYSIMTVPVIKKWLDTGSARAAEKAKRAQDEQRIWEEDLKMFK